jgi:hypothetical protein
MYGTYTDNYAKARTALRNIIQEGSSYTSNDEQQYKKRKRQSTERFGFKKIDGISHFVLMI